MARPPAQSQASARAARGRASSTDELGAWRQLTLDRNGVSFTASWRRLGRQVNLESELGRANAVVDDGDAAQRAEDLLLGLLPTEPAARDERSGGKSGG